MGIDYNADLGYGIKVTDQKLADKIGMGKIEVEVKDFEIIWAGDAYAEEMDTFLVIKKSVQSTHSWDDQKSPIKPEKLIVQPDWDDKLRAWCKEYGITKPKIGWWLCSSVS